MSLTLATTKSCSSWRGIMTASQLERAVRAYRQVTAKEADDLHALAYAGYSWGADGSLIVRAQLAA